jgi:hypothetical protein
MRKRHYGWAVLALASLGFVGCDDAPEEGRATIAVTLNGGSPIESDVSDGGVIFEDLIAAAFLSRSYNKFITEPRGDVIIEKYRITWERTDGGSGVLSPREETTNFYVPINESAPTNGTIRLVTWADKTGPVLAPLVGTLNTVEMRCTVEFTAREVGTEAEVKTSVSASVHFADTV